MSKRIFDVVDGKVIITPEALLISPFEEIWNSDKSTGKKVATEKIKFIWFYSDSGSPYNQNYSEEVRGKHIVIDVLKDKSYKITKDMTDGCNKYVELYTRAEERLVDGAEMAIYQMDKYYRTVDFTKLGENDIKRVSDSIVALPKLVQAIKDARKAAQSDESSSNKVRGGASVGLFENE